ncbi:MAG: ABC transporter substrate-binding protein [Desulfobacterales bacterium]|nr:ABC transporter substrate-binding protein [Desulfobacterales bacterium]
MKLRMMWLALVVAAAMMMVQAATAAPKGTLRVALTSDPNSLDLCYGADRNASNAGWRLYNSLVVVNDDGMIEPALAESWEVTDGGKVYTMKLRKGVKFHNGEDFSADSVIFSWNRGKGKDVTWRKKWDIVKDVEKVDDFTIRLKLDAPYPLLLRQVSYFWNIVPEGYLKEVGEDGFVKHPVGTGPFRFVEWKKGDRLVYEANPDYWEEDKPKAAKVVFRPIAESATRMAAIKTGEMDIVSRLTAEEAAMLKGVSGVKVVEYPVDRVFYITFNNLTSGKGLPTENAKVRQAMNYAVDIDAIVDALFNGHGRPTNGFFVPSNLGYNASVKPFGYDPEKAKALLKEAGYPDGFSIEMAAPTGAYSQFEQVCEAIQGYLSEVGIDMKLTLMESGKYWDLEAKKELPPMFGDSWSCREGEPLERLEGTLGGWKQSYSSWHDPKIEEMLTKVAVIPDEKQRAAIYMDLQKYMFDNPPFIYLYQPMTFEAISTKVKNYKPRAAEDYYLKNVSIED